jgi:hypothetical protein
VSFIIFSSGILIPLAVSSVRKFVSKYKSVNQGAVPREELSFTVCIDVGANICAAGEPITARNVVIIIPTYHYLMNERSGDKSVLQ